MKSTDEATCIESKQRKLPEMIIVGSSEDYVVEPLKKKERKQKVKKEPIVTMPDNELGYTITTLYDAMKTRRVLTKTSQSRNDRLVKEYNKIERILKRADEPPLPENVLQAALEYYRLQPFPTDFETGTPEDKEYGRGGLFDSPSQVFFNYDILIEKLQEIRRSVSNLDKKTRTKQILTDTHVKSFLETLLSCMAAPWEVPYESQLDMVALSFSYYMDWATSVEFKNLPLHVQKHCDPEYMLREYYQSIKQPIKRQKILNKSWLNAVAKRISGE